MKLIGHKTESMYVRYSIAAPKDLVDATARLGDYTGRMQGEPKTVVEIDSKKKGAL